MTELLYILSPSYSGSTLLTFLLGTHPAIATVGELKATSHGDVESYLCSCGTRIIECGFWRRVTDELARHGVAFDVRDFGTHFRLPRRGLADRLVSTRFRNGIFETVRDTALRWLPGAHDAFQAIIEKNRAIIDVVTALKGGRSFLDGSKDPIRLKYFRDAGYWSTRVVRLIRDGRASSSSYMRIHKAAMFQAAARWRQNQEECDRMAESLPTDSVLSVRYESLCAQPDKSLGDIFGFLGLDPALARKDFRAVEQHLLGHTMRLRDNKEIALDEKWKTKLTSEDLRIFDRIAGGLNWRHGYD